MLISLQHSIAKCGVRCRKYQVQNACKNGRTSNFCHPHIFCVRAKLKATFLQQMKNVRALATRVVFSTNKTANCLRKAIVCWFPLLDSPKSQSQSPALLHVKSNEQYNAYHCKPLLEFLIKSVDFFSMICCIKSNSFSSYSSTEGEHDSSESME